MAWRLSGTYTALVTPFRHDSRIDWPALDRLLDQQLQAGVDGLVVLGTTGECPTVGREEADALIRFVHTRVAGRACVVAGVSSNDTRDAVERAREAQAAGADALMVTCPYYSRPSQPGLIAHFAAVAAAAPLPQIVYNIVGRTGVNLTPDSLLRLSRIDNIVGLKEANPDIAHAVSLLACLPDDFAVLSGNDDMTLPLIALGARGTISTLSNLLPAAVKQMVDAALAERWQEARERQRALLPLMRGCGLETNPIPIKTALAWRGDIEEAFRLPLCPMQEAPAAEWRRLLTAARVLPRAAERAA